MKASELQGAALDWAVAKCEGFKYTHTIAAWRNKYGAQGGPQVMVSNKKDSSHDFSPHDNWSQGGPIIEREAINVRFISDGQWECWPETGMNDENICYGPTPLIAAMRCYCCAKLGDEVEVPEELTC